MIKTRALLILLISTINLFANNANNSTIIDNLSIEEISKLAKQGDNNAKFKLANAYFNGNNGNGVEKDEKLAFYWYKQVATEGYPAAQFNVANSYYNGIGVKKSIDNAVIWYEKAAKQNLPNAAHNLATIYLNNKKNLEKAIYWYEKASNLGHKESKIVLNKINQQQKSKQLAKIENKDKLNNIHQQQLNNHLTTSNNDIVNKNYLITELLEKNLRLLNQHKKIKQQVEFLTNKLQEKDNLLQQLELKNQQGFGSNRNNERFKQQLLGNQKIIGDLKLQIKQKDKLLTSINDKNINNIGNYNYKIKKQLLDNQKIINYLKLQVKQQNKLLVDVNNTNKKFNNLLLTKDYLIADLVEKNKELSKQQDELKQQLSLLNTNTNNEYNLIKNEQQKINSGLYSLKSKMEQNKVSKDALLNIKIKNQLTDNQKIIKNLKLELDKKDKLLALNNNEKIKVKSQLAQNNKVIKQLENKKIQAESTIKDLKNKIVQIKSINLSNKKIIVMYKKALEYKGKNNIKYLDLMKEVAEYNHPKSQYELANIYLLGDIVDKDLQQSYYFAMKSLNGGNKMAKNLLKKIKQFE